MKNKNLWLYGIIAFTFIFIASSVIFRIFDVEILPSQFFGALIGVVITAIITVFLLNGQTSAEETKERNVKVFEEKSARFNNFINKLWEIWDDRVVELEELNELIKLVSRDIVLYTKPETVDKILSNLIIIAEQAKPDKTSKKDAEVTKLIQQCIFDIINELAKEIDLGGEIKPEIRSKLNQLEEKVVPFLIQKDFKKNYIQQFKDTIENSEEEIDFSNIEYKNKFLWCQVKDSNVFFRVGPLEREKNHGAMIGAYVEFWRNRNYQKFRDAARGWRKDYLRGMRNHLGAKDIINFSDYEVVEKMYYQLNNDGEETQNELAKKVINLYKTWKIDGKNIEEIIEECNPKK
ncbi:hypothetical protein [Flavobacterium filum]|uniref:hypothetical protein n=1 Tax=Flavobacterium filum TaxID=370974 RepID=UPI000413636C|nr:hypothetical protein [Flavobacterium filum]HRP91101.1 hypothetical protein [Edaphocola sp.]